MYDLNETELASVVGGNGIKNINSPGSTISLVDLSTNINKGQVSYSNTSSGNVVVTNSPTITYDYFLW